jgi:hypothetical protein
MYQERTNTIIDNFAIMISCEDGLKQVFQGNPLHYVKKLKSTIDNYRNIHGIS